LTAADPTPFSGLRRVFGGLVEIGCYDRPDTVMVSSVFAENENAHEVSRLQLATMSGYVAKYR
jgi:myo-inositol catabolism protein IolH